MRYLILKPMLHNGREVYGARIGDWMLLAHRQRSRLMLCIWKVKYRKAPKIPRGRRDIEAFLVESRFMD